MAGVKFVAIMLFFLQAYPLAMKIINLIRWELSTWALWQPTFSLYDHYYASGSGGFCLTQLHFKLVYYSIQIIRYMFRSYDHVQAEIHTT
jgi:hypothetical protein